MLAPVSVEQRRETLERDLKFINQLLSNFDLPPFPFSVVVTAHDGEGYTQSELYSLENSVKILSSLLTCKQVF